MHSSGNKGTHGNSQLAMELSLNILTILQALLVAAWRRYDYPESMQLSYDFVRLKL